MSFHVAIIMDGNGRWAESRGKPRPTGHRAGVDAVRRVVEAAPGLGISVLTLYAFSADNWSRPRPEVRAIMGLLGRYLRAEATALAEQGVRVEVIGRRDRLPDSVLAAVGEAEARASERRNLLLRLCVDYSGRQALAAGATRLLRRAEAGTEAGSTVTPEALERAMVESIHGSPDAGPVDLLIRTGGEQRLSDFLLWESAYAELVFLPVLWPDFNAVHLSEALREFGGRERRFGGLPSLATSA